MSTFRLTDASPEAVDYVLTNLWERGEQEFALLGITKEQAAGFIARQRDVGLPTMAGWIDSDPVFISGLTHADDPSGMVTWFQATELFTPYVHPITHALREAMERTATAYNLAYIEIHSPCVHPKSGRWFKALGFDLDVDRHVAQGPTLYRFVRRFGNGSLPCA